MNGPFSYPKQVVFVGLTVFLGILLAGSAAAQVIIAQIPVPNSGLLTVDPTLNQVYLGLGNPSAQTVTVINGYSFTTSQPGPVGQFVGVNRLNDNWWAPGVYSGQVLVYDGTTDSLLATLSPGYCPQEADYDRKYNRVWVGAQCGSGNDPVFAYNATTYAPQAGPLGTGGVLGGITVNSHTGILYAASNGIERVDPVTFAVTVTGLPFFPGTTDPARNLLYGLNASTLYIASGGSRTAPERILHTITLPYTPSGQPAVNTALEHVYIQNSSTQTIDVRNSTSGADISTFSLGSGVTGLGFVAADSIRGRIYALVQTSGGWYVYVLEDLLPAKTVSPGY
jgi:hypothetical protein